MTQEEVNQLQRAKLLSRDELLEWGSGDGWTYRMVLKGYQWEMSAEYPWEVGEG